MGRLGKLWPIAAALLAASPCVGADHDVVRMKSGDVVTGRIERIEDDEVVIDLAFSTTIEIEFKYVASIQTERPVTIRFEDGREISGYVDVGPDGAMSVRLAETRGYEAARRRSERLGLPMTLERSGREREPLVLADVRGLEPSYTRYEAGISLGLNAATGNTDSTAFDASAFVKPSWGPNSISLEANGAQRTSNGDLDAKNWQASLTYERELPGRWLAVGVSGFESDPFQDLVLRSVVGVGPGYRFYDTSKTDLRSYAGPAYVNENYEGSASDRAFGGLLFSTIFEREFFSSDVTIYHRHQLLKAIGNPQFIASTVQGVTFDLFGDFDLSVEFDFSHTQEPPSASLESNDFRYILKLDYEFEGDERDWFH